jgi:hypothetical protein
VIDGSQDTQTTDRLRKQAIFVGVPQAAQWRDACRIGRGTLLV